MNHDEIRRWRRRKALERHWLTVLTCGAEVEQRGSQDLEEIEGRRLLPPWPKAARWAPTAMMDVLKASKLDEPGV
jgi:hypothetical protein